MCKLTDFIEQVETAGTYSTKRIQSSGLSLYLSPTHVESSELLSDWAPWVLQKLKDGRMSW